MGHEVMKGGGLIEKATGGHDGRGQDLLDRPRRRGDRHHLGEEAFDLTGRHRVEDRGDPPGKGPIQRGPAQRCGAGDVLGRRLGHTPPADALKRSVEHPVLDSLAGVTACGELDVHAIGHT